jgi:hypothetical protein
MFIIVETQDKQQRKKPGARREKKFLILFYRLFHPAPARLVSGLDFLGLGFAL